MSEIKLTEEEGGGEFFIELDGERALLKFRIIKERKLMVITDTFTPPQYRGRGIASKLMKKALEYAKEKRLLVYPLCSFAVYYFKKHPEFADLLPEDVKARVYGESNK